HVSDQLRHGWTHALAQQTVRRFEARPGIDAPYGLAKGLRGNGARVDADPADRPPPLDHGHALTEFCGLNRRPLSGGATPDANEVVIVRRHRPNLSRSWSVGERAGKPRAYALPTPSRSKNGATIQGAPAAGGQPDTIEDLNSPTLFSRHIGHLDSRVKQG